MTGSIRLSGGVLWWVLTAHGIALLLPLALVWAAAAHGDYLAAVTDYPAMFFAAAAVMMAASAFEIAQNSIDQWYLTPETGSAGGTGFCDLMFYWLIVASQALVITACFGGLAWLTVLVWLPVAVYPWFYVRDRLAIAPLAVLGTGSVAAGWFSFGDPVILLQLLVSPLTGVFFAALLKTGAQSLHGFTTLTAAANVPLLVWAIAGSAGGEPTPAAVAAALAVLMVAAIALVPRLTRDLDPTPLPEA